MSSPFTFDKKENPLGEEVRGKLVKTFSYLIWPSPWVLRGAGCRKGFLDKTDGEMAVNFDIQRCQVKTRPQSQVLIMTMNLDLIFRRNFDLGEETILFSR